MLNALNVEASFIAAQVAAMSEVLYAKTSNRSVLGIMNQFSDLTKGYREYLETSDPALFTKAAPFSLHFNLIDLASLLYLRTPTLFCCFPSVRASLAFPTKREQPPKSP